MSLLTVATPPEEGEFIAYKKGYTCGRAEVIKIKIPADAKRTGSYVGRKCRASHVIVLEGEGISRHDGITHYAPGLTVTPDSYDPDPRVECTHGIHFFMTRAEAENY